MTLNHLVAGGFAIGLGVLGGRYLDAQGYTGNVRFSPNYIDAQGNRIVGDPPGTAYVTVPPLSLIQSNAAQITVNVGAPGNVTICFEGAACHTIAEWRSVP